VLEDIDPFGERRDDRRIAVLAQVLVGALGATKVNQQPFLAADYQRLLDVDAVPRIPAASVPAQTADEAERRLDSWISGSNQVFKEGGGRR
jgi:hypothetical protein